MVVIGAANYFFLSEVKILKIKILIGIVGYHTFPSDNQINILIIYLSM